ncbi:MAG: redoxin domain-containing protein [Firmicutes bacterium]|nr:redoxin domain-containing protein [Bacillota bacterium]
MIRKILPSKLLLLALLVVVLAGCGEKPRTVAPVEGAQAPDFSGPALNGKTIALKDLRGKQAVLSFWRTDSPPGIRELNALTELQEEKGDKVEILTVNVGEDKTQVDIFIKEKKLALPVILDDGKTTIAKLYRIDYIPTTFILDEQGVILKKVNGGMVKSEVDNVLK